MLSFAVISSIQERMYNLYKFSDEELESVLHQTYTRRNSLAMVVRVSEEASRYGLYNKRYNELRLEYVPEPNNPWLHLTIYSIDDGMWRAFLPLHLIYNQTMEELWENVRKCIFLDLTQEYFIDFTKAFFGATGYDWN